MTSFEIKYVDRPTRDFIKKDPNNGNGDGDKIEQDLLLPIVSGGGGEPSLATSYSPIIAVLNTLLLQGKIKLPNFGNELISSETAQSLLTDYAIEYQGDAIDFAVLQEISDTFVTRTRMDIPWQCTYGLEEMQESAPDVSKVFRGLGLTLLNGSVIDIENRNDEFAALVMAEKDSPTGDRQRLGQMLSDCQQNNPTSNLAICLEMACSGGFRPLTPYAYRLLQSDVVKEGRLHILTFGGRFYTLVKQKRKLYVLVTTTADRDNVVWQRLDRIYVSSIGENKNSSPFVDSDLKSIGIAATGGVVSKINFTDDLLWCYEPRKANLLERIQDYDMLGYDPSSCANRLPAMSNATINSTNNNNTETNESDEDLAKRLQQMEIEQGCGIYPGLGDSPAGGGGGGDGGTGAGNLQAGGLRTTLARMGQISPSIEETPDVDFNGPIRKWNLDLIIGMEVRSKYYLELSKTDDAVDDWEIWDRASNHIRFATKDVTCPDELPRDNMDDSAVNLCIGIMNLQQKIIPETMLEMAQRIAMEDLLMRDEEKEHLQKILDGSQAFLAVSAGEDVQDATNSDLDELYRTTIRSALTSEGGLTVKALTQTLLNRLENSNEMNASVFARVVADMIADGTMFRRASDTGDELYTLNRADNDGDGRPGQESGSDSEDSDSDNSDSDDSEVPGLVDRNLEDDETEDEEEPEVLVDQVEATHLDDSDDDLSDLPDTIRIQRLEEEKKDDEVPRASFTRGTAPAAIQSLVRMFQARRNYRVDLKLKKKYAISVQALWRRHAVRLKAKKDEAATKFQAPCRGFLEKTRYKKKTAAGALLVAAGRGHLARMYCMQFRVAIKINAVARGFLAKRLATRIVLSIKINALIRRFLSKRRHGPAIKAGFEEWKLVNKQWNPVKACVAAKALCPTSSLFSWQNLKKTAFDINQAEEDKEINARIDAAREEFTSDDESDKENDEDEQSEDSTSNNKILSAPKPAMSDDHYQECDKLLAKKYDNILLSQAALKWFKNADRNFQGFFLRRMHQFANGEYERSHKLRKRLTGCKHIIYEAYLEQKVAHRIIFTECRTTDGEGDASEMKSILVWYVSTHDRVSRYIKQIDETEARMNRQFRKSASELFDDESDEGSAMALDNDTILLDPFANTPLKIHQLPSSDIDKLELESWTPPFRLTNDERKIVQTKGTVLVLGRSGTGKTVCIVNRVAFDAEFHHRSEGTTVLKQLFISRSRRIKDLVQQLVEDVTVDTKNLERSFVSFERIMRDCNSALTKLGLPTNAKAIEESKLHQDFSGFEQFFVSIEKEVKTSLTPLVLWTQIRTYIKGSIEAVMKGSPLDQSEYLTLGKNYCRLNPGQREESYAVYQKYASWLDSNGYYDSCDRTVDLLNRIKKVPLEMRIKKNMRFDKIYIDECQDFTSSDFALFWRLCQGGGDLFLAGDTAQSVEQGIAFRFEDVKRVFYEMKKEDLSMGIPESPLTIQINFRSHSGVLEVAADVLKILHEAFPGAANKLQGDQGLFKGPRPCLLNRRGEKSLDHDALCDIVSKNPSLVVLTPDENTAALKERLGTVSEGLVVLGICEAKGLDFDEVVIVDFFSTASERLSKAWKALFRTANNSKNLDSDFHDTYPELEMRLKLLYTAITRCRHRLFFVETTQSQVCEGFSRWVLHSGLAEKQDVADLSVQLKSADEWRSLGVEYAINAESQATAEDAAAWFKRASKCFARADDKELVSKSDAQAKLRVKAMALATDKDWLAFKQEVPGLIMECLDSDSGFIEEAIDICENILDRCPMKDKKVKDAVQPILWDMKAALGRM